MHSDPSSRNKQASNELEKLTQLKNESLEKLQHLKLYPHNSNQAGSMTAAPERAAHKTSGNDTASGKYEGSLITSEISQILSKYNNNNNNNNNENEPRTSAPAQRFSNSIHEASELNEMSFNTGNNYNQQQLNSQTVNNNGGFITQGQEQHDNSFCNTVPYQSAIKSQEDTANLRQVATSRHPEALQENKNALNTQSYALMSQSAKHLGQPLTHTSEHSFSNETQPQNPFLYNHGEHTSTLNTKSATPLSKESHSRANYNPAISSSAGKALETVTKPFEQLSGRQTFNQEDSFTLMSGRKSHDKENTSTNWNFSGIPPHSGTAAKAREEKKSGAFMNAMKALQEQVAKLEEENRKLKGDVKDSSSKHSQEMSELREKLEKEQRVLRDKANELESFNRREREYNSRAKEESERLQEDLANLQQQLSNAKSELIREKEERIQASNESAILKKELKLIEGEKDRHLEENANERDQFDTKLNGMMERLQHSQTVLSKLDAELSEALEAKVEAERQLEKLVKDTTLNERKDQLVVVELQGKLEESHHHIASLEEKCIAMQEKLEREKSNCQKKIASAEERIKEAAHSCEDKMMVYNTHLFPIVLT